jgi:hypothetical protein
MVCVHQNINLQRTTQLMQVLHYCTVSSTFLAVLVHPVSNYLSQLGSSIPG